MTTSRASARELYHTGSGQPAPKPTDDEIAAAINSVLYRFINTNDPAFQAAVVEAARKVRQLFPTTTTDAIAKDTV